MACTAQRAKAAATAEAPAHAHEAPTARRRGGGSNQAALLAAGIQAKLRVGGVQDAAEHEADRLAERFAFGAAVPQPCCSGCAESTPAGTVQRSALPGAAAQPAVDRLPLGDGAPLAAGLRGPLEHHLDADLSAVRVHTDGRAAAASERIGARAFAHGSDIAFGAGQYAPHSAEGRRLIAHEVVHTVQQGRGAGTPRQRGVPRVRGENGKQFTPEEMQFLAKWQEQNALQEFTNQLGQDPRVHQKKAPDSPFGFSGGSGGDWSQQLRWENGRWVDPKDTYSDVCPSCHQRPWEIREQRQQREAELARKKLEEAWPGMHAKQQDKALAGLAATLNEDIASSHLAATQARLALFDNALAATPMLGDELLGLPTSALSAELRSHWLLAAQAAVLVDNYINAPAGSIESAAMEPARKAWITYFNTVAKMLGEMDRAEARRQARWQPRGAQPKQQTCPGGCHAPAPQPASDFLQGYGQADPLPRSRIEMPDDVRTMPTATATTVGPLVARTNKAVIATQAAADVAAWKAARADYQWTIGQLDRVLRTRGSQGWGGKDLVEQLDFAQGLLERQQVFKEEHPAALKVQAVFFPKFDFEDTVDEKGQRVKGARSIPWHFYLVRTPVAPGTRIVPAGYTWELHDITAPKRPGGRTVKTSYQVDMIAALARERYDPKPIDQMDPPPVLFDELNHRDFFPEGMLYWNYPLSGKRGSLQTTAPRPFGEWLKLIGMAVAVIGGVLLPMVGAPAALAFAAMAGGTALSIAGSLHRMNEMEAHGVLTQAERDRFYWDIALDVANMLTLGLGRVATVARAAGAVRAARTAETAYFYVRRAEIGMDLVNVGIISHDLLAQYRTIQGSKMSPDEKSRAMRELFAMGLLSGALSFVSLRAGAHDLTKKPTLTLDVDPLNPSRTVARLEEGAEVAAEAGRHDAARSGAKAQEVATLPHFNTKTGEKHTYRFWDDGRITRCSEPPCLMLSQSLVSRIGEMGDTMLAKSRHHAEVQDMAGRASLLLEEAAAVARLPKGKQKAAADAVLVKVKALEEELAAVRRNVDTENLVFEGGGFKEAGDRYGPAAQQYDRSKYRWAYYKETGELKFQRKSMYVPKGEWKDGQLVYKPMFPVVDAATAQKVRDTSLSRDFNVVATINTVEDLRRLRPASPYADARPKDWVVVRIDDSNLNQFATEPVPHGTIFEFPGGQRVWRTAENTIKTDAPLGAPTGRQGWEGGKLPQLRTDKQGQSNQGVPVIEATGVEHQRAHPRGQGTGFELYNHIPLAPTYVNQQLQARGIELYLSQLRKARPDLDLRLSTTHKNIPDTLRQEFIEYNLSVVGSDGLRRDLFGVRIWTDYGNKAKPARTQVTAMPKTAADMDLITNTVDMGAALADMEQAIRNARGRKRGK
ncbi:MAG: DUF4157 domain-containing protein [Burkholderiales bacterium]|nr:DUF4157 domain-containing protein [Burkholderiales bacterium]